MSEQKIKNAFNELLTLYREFIAESDHKQAAEGAFIENMIDAIFEVATDKDQVFAHFDLAVEDYGDLDD